MPKTPRPSQIPNPHRSSELVALCGECAEPARRACPRCSRPQCDDHATTGERRCASCEADWAHRQVALVKETPEKIDAWRAFKLGVLAPSAGTGALIGSILALLTAFTAGLGPALAVAGQVFMVSFIFLTLLLTVPFFAVGTPLFARRKILEIAQTVRESNARQRFLSERAEPDGKSSDAP